MTRNDFIQLLEEPNIVGASHIIDLQGIIKEYPYFQSSYLLLAKAFHTSENINFENHLKKSAAYASDRKHLHQLLFDETAKQAKEELETTENDLTIPPEEPIISSTSNEIKEQPEPTAFTISIEEIPELEHNDLLEKQLLSSAISSSILMEVSNEIPQMEEFQATLVEDTGMDNLSIVEDIPIKSFNEGKTHSFSEWINFFNDEESEEESQNEEELNANDTLPINEFGLTTSKTEFFSATKMARLSVQEDDDLVTETLANIYADQGNYEKAIKAFEKLQLKYPEKRVYFAGRIKEIQNYII